MPCDMGVSTAELAYSDAAEARRKNRDNEQRIAGLEEALCGLVQMILAENTVPLHPQLAEWWEHHKSLPGCAANKP